MFLEVLFGILAAALSVVVVAKIYPKKDHVVWRMGLIIAAIIYVLFALFSASWLHIPIELGGVLLYGIFVYLSKKYTIFWLAIGWALHVCWDIFLHTGTNMNYAPTWYPGVCLGFDLVIAGYIFWVWWKSHSSVSSLLASL